MKHTISVLVENHAGVLARVAGLFARRGFNIDSLAVGVTDDERVSRITIVADGSAYTLEQRSSSTSSSTLSRSRRCIVIRRSHVSLCS